MENQFKLLGVAEDIVRALSLLGLTEPTPVQQQGIPAVLAGRDVVVQSQTGSGKTAAFAIPLCHLVDWAENKPQALILTPTRELAMQIQQETANIGKLKRIKVPAVFGKHSFTQQTKDLKQKCHMVVGTPGRVLDHLERGTMDLSQLKYLVLDEADEMLNMGFLEQVSAIIDQIPNPVQKLLFSATMPKDILTLIGQYMDEPQMITIASDGVTTDRIGHHYYDATEWDKIELLQGILMVLNPDSCIIFANTREMVDQIRDELLDSDFTCDGLHGGMEQWERTEVMQAFKRGEFRYLVATDVAARGIDIDNIALVVNFELPHERESYVHRIGRTGRAGQQGMAISLVEQQEQRHLANIERFISLPITLQQEPSFDEVMAAKPAFIEKMRQMPELKQEKKAVFAQEIMKLRIGDGKKMKIRPVDIVGTLCAIPGVEASDIGIITILDWSTYVEILNNKGEMVLEALQSKPIKGQLRTVQKAPH